MGVGMSVPSRCCTLPELVRIPGCLLSAGSWLPREAAGDSIRCGSLPMLCMGKPRVAPYSSSQAQGTLLRDATARAALRSWGSFQMPWN